MYTSKERGKSRRLALCEAAIRAAQNLCLRTCTWICYSHVGLGYLGRDTWVGWDLGVASLAGDFEFRVTGQLWVAVALLLRLYVVSVSVSVSV
jgi:hypothetical protein